MQIGKTLYVKNRKQWRAWLAKNHSKEKEIWLVYYKKHSGKARIPYNDAVEEALCFGWIDSTVKKIDDEKFAQRFTPRRNASQWSEMNKERVRRLIRLGKMMPPGLEKAKNLSGIKKDRLEIPADILKALKKSKMTWEHFSKFPDSYKMIRVGWIAAAKHRPAIFKQRLGYFVKMTKQNKKFGMVR